MTQAKARQGRKVEGKRVRTDKGARARARVDMADNNSSWSGGNAAATTGYCGVCSGSKDGECAAATAAARTSARARAGAMRRQQHQ